MQNTDKDTLFMFPERCSMGVIKGNINNSIVPIHFSTLELELAQSNSNQFEEIFHLIRQSKSIRITHLPHPLKYETGTHLSGSSMIVSFHVEQNDVQKLGSPLIAAVVSLVEDDYLREMNGFNEHIVQMESLGLSMSFGKEMTILQLLELQAVSESALEHLPLRISNFLLEPIYYAEFRPQLKDTLEPLMHALNHQRASKPAILSLDSVDLSGIIPDGLA
ncbi:hypothetical protein K8T06_13215 [bacterium]|nr:hypothetical protein [bacterium]